MMNEYDLIQLYKMINDLKKRVESLEALLASNKHGD